MCGNFGLNKCDWDVVIIQGVSKYTRGLQAFMLGKHYDTDLRNLYRWKEQLKILFPRN
jgi:hypothetical protein